MSRQVKHNLFAMALLIGLGVALGTSFTVFGQLQQSGGPGSTVTANQGTAAAASGAWPAKVTDGTNTATVTAQGLKVDLGGGALTATSSALDVNLKSGSIANTAFGISAGTNLIGKVVPLTACGTTWYDSGITVIPGSSTAITTTATCVFSIFVTNTTGSAATFSLTDNAGTPNNYIVSFSVPANSNMLLPMGGIKFLSGIKWSQVTTSAVLGQIVGVQ